MPNLKDYPKLFNPNGHNFLPPKKILESPNIIFCDDFGPYRDIELPKLKDGETYRIDYITCDDDERYVTIQVVNNNKRENLNYQKELNEYNKKVADWKEIKNRWDEESEKEKECKEYKDYLKLKKKFEK